MPDTFRCGAFVAQRIKQLLGDSPGSLSPTSRGLLAQLRQAVGREPGTVPNIWSITLEGVPELPASQQLRTETAIHTALTLFAVHQQAQPLSMHVSGQGFGRAVRVLAQRNAPDGDVHASPVYRRFTAACAAASVSSLTKQTRSLIEQLRAEQLPMDYARFADDLYWFQVPSRTKSVQRAWGRQFHHSTLTDTEGVSQ